MNGAAAVRLNDPGQRISRDGVEAGEPPGTILQLDADASHTHRVAPSIEGGHDDGLHRWPAILRDHVASHLYLDSRPPRQAQSHHLPDEQEASQADSADRHRQRLRHLRPHCI